MHGLKAEKEKHVHRVELGSIEYPSIIGVSFDSDKASIDINPNSTTPPPPPPPYFCICICRLKFLKYIFLNACIDSGHKNERKKKKYTCVVHRTRLDSTTMIAQNSSHSPGPKPEKEKEKKYTCVVRRMRLDSIE